MCGEMLKDPTAPEVRLYAKTLSNLELSRDETVRKDLQTLLQQLVQVNPDTTRLKSQKAIPRTTSPGWLITHSHLYGFMYLYSCVFKGLLFHFSSSYPSFVQVVKDRVCLRALEKMINQLVDSKEQAELLSASALQPLDVNADGTHASTAIRPPDIVLRIRNKCYLLSACV